MSNKKKTPKELLRTERELLERKSDMLVDSIENTLGYTRDNIVPIIGQTALETVLPMLPPFVQRILRGGSECVPNKKTQEELSFFSLGSLAEIAIDFLPFMLKGKKGIIFTFILKKLKRFFS